jgi:hypothetical protein
MGPKKENFPAPLVIEDIGKALIKLDSRFHGNAGKENLWISGTRIWG